MSLQSDATAFALVSIDSIFKFYYFILWFKAYNLIIMLLLFEAMDFILETQNMSRMCNEFLKHP
jgi:hypothetical protein